MIAVIDYGIGNLRSAEKALQHLGRRRALTTDAARDRRAPTRWCCPGSGASVRAWRALRASGPRSGDETRRDRRPAVPRHLHRDADAVRRQRRVARTSPGSAIVPGRVTRLPDTVRLPQMGWNTLAVTPGRGAARTCPIRRGSTSCTRYAPEPTDDGVVAAWCELRRGASPPRSRPGIVWATQFHPEKIGRRRPAAAAELRAKRAAVQMELYPGHRSARRPGRAARAGRLRRARPSTTTIRSRWRADFEAAGARWIHVVDLDAARDGGDANLAVIDGDLRERGACTGADGRRRAHRRGRAASASRPASRAS